MRYRQFRVWHAGGHDRKDGVSVFARSAAAAAERAAALLFEPHDPIDRFDVFVRAKREPAFRFTILVDVTRVRYDEKAASVTPESVSFVACLFTGPKSIMSA